MRTIRVAILGLGAVGKRIAHLLDERKESYRKLYATEVRLVAICTSKKGLHREDGISPEELNAPSSLQDRASGVRWLEQEVGLPDVLFDCGPSDFDATPEPSSLAYYRLMLSAGKAVVAVSKSALVSHGPELATTSKENGGWIGLSGAAGAAVPALDLLRNSVLGCTMTKIEGCLNATTNYILDALMQGTPLDHDLSSSVDQSDPLMGAIKLAQQQGVAERDTSRDVGGFDSMAKLVLLANFGVCNILENNHMLDECISVDDVKRTGLSNDVVTPEIVVQWKEANMTPRLVGMLERKGDTENPSKWHASVSLLTNPATHPFSALKGTLKGFMIHTKEMGGIFVSACGSEPEATAASSLKDFEAWLRSAGGQSAGKKSSS